MPISDIKTLSESEMLAELRKFASLHDKAQCRAVIYAGLGKTWNYAYFQAITEGFDMTVGKWFMLSNPTMYDFAWAKQQKPGFEFWYADIDTEGQVEYFAFRSTDNERVTLKAQLI